MTEPFQHIKKAQHQKIKPVDPKKPLEIRLYFLALWIFDQLKCFDHTWVVRAANGTDRERENKMQNFLNIIMCWYWINKSVLFFVIIIVLCYVP